MAQFITALKLSFGDSDTINEFLQIYQDFHGPAKVAFVGNFGAGKTTLINRLLGGEVLEEKLPNSPEMYQPAPPIIRHCVLGMQQVTELSSSEVLHQHPSVFAGVQLIDTGGFDGGEEHQRLTLGILRESDVIVWVMFPNSFPHHPVFTPMLQNVFKEKKPFMFVVNHMDNCQAPEACRVAFSKRRAEVLPGEIDGNSAYFLACLNTPLYENEFKRLKEAINLIREDKYQIKFNSAASAMENCLKSLRLKPTMELKRIYHGECFAALEQTGTLMSSLIKVDGDYPWQSKIKNEYSKQSSKMIEAMTQTVKGYTFTHLANLANTLEAKRNLADLWNGLDATFFLQAEFSPNPMLEEFKNSFRNYFEQTFKQTTMALLSKTWIRQVPVIRGVRALQAGDFFKKPVSDENDDLVKQLAESVSNAFISMSNEIRSHFNSFSEKLKISGILGQISLMTGGCWVGYASWISGQTLSNILIGLSLFTNLPAVVAVGIGGSCLGAGTYYAYLKYVYSSIMAEVERCRESMKTILIAFVGNLAEKHKNDFNLIINDYAGHVKTYEDTINVTVADLNKFEEQLEEVRGAERASKTQKLG